MARKPIQHEMVGLLTPRERMWQAVRKLGEFSAMSLQDSMPKPIMNLETIQDYLLQLSRAGHLQRLGEQGRKGGTKFDEVRFKLVKDSFEAPRVGLKGQKIEQGTQTLAMWRAMKALKDFDYHDVQHAASLGNVCQVTAQTAKSYVVLLARAGYFRTVREAKPGTPARYRLVRDTGAHAPAITRRKAVFDRNAGEFTWQQPEQEVCDGLE